jgi:hypothetical protein
MVILDMQKSIREAGRIRTGVEETTSRGRRPKSLTTFRLTSTDEDAIKAVAAEYGGNVEPWDNDGRKEFEVITEAEKLPVIVPPKAVSFDQFMELWSGGGCKRRCDTQTELLSLKPCMCDPANRQCEPHTRLRVLLGNIPGLGLWRLDTESYYAAKELLGAIETIEFFAARGQMMPAVLRIEQRSVKRPGEPAKRFIVPILDIAQTPTQMMTGVVNVEPPRVLTPVPEASVSAGSIAEQVGAVKEIESRRRPTTPSMPATGIKARTAAGYVPPSDRIFGSAAKNPVDGKLAGTPPDDPWAAVDEDRAANDDPENFPAASQTTPDDQTGHAGGGDEDPAASHINGDIQTSLAGGGDLQMAERWQFEKLNDLFLAKGFEKADSAGRMAWATAALRTRLNKATDLTFEQANTLINLMSYENNLARIGVMSRTLYSSEQATLDDLSTFLQLETPLTRLSDLDPDDAAAIMGALEMRMGQR